MKEDERQLWEAVVTAKPDEHGLVHAWPLGLALGIPIKRIEYLCSKWHGQGKWIHMGTMTGTPEGLDDYHASCERARKARELGCKPWEVPE